MLSVLMLFLTGIVVALFAGPVPGAITSSLQSILKNTHGSNEYEYPTDLTRDILPVSNISIDTLVLNFLDLKDQCC